ncbi:MAG TPA: PAS domain-containing protein [Pyrinomonadaceae bacterium]|jgi:PAS domain S-box-containing protein|nr:PAS domain-containing protein [Pyrinomonadaceae bacterium]
MARATSTDRPAIHEQATQVLVRDRGHYASSLEAVTGVAVFDEHLRYVQINEALARLNGLSVEEHLGKTLHEIAPHVAPVLEPLLEKIFETGEPALNVELKSQRANQPGPPRYWRLSFIPVPGDDGRPQGVSVMAVEITNLRLVKHPRQPHANIIAAGQNGGQLQSDVPLDRQIRVLRDVSAALSTAAEILEQAQTREGTRNLDISNGIDFYEEVRRYEDALISRALKLTGGNQKRAASLLGIKPTTLHTILKRHKIEQD